MPEDLGTIQIGIRADLSQLERDLADMANKVRDFPVPGKEIRIRIRTPEPDAIAVAQRKIASTLLKAQTLKVELAPTLTVKNTKISEFRNELQRLFDKANPIAVPMTADINGQALRDQILGSIGIVDIPLTWHWAGEPPPGELGEGGTGGTGGQPARPTGPAGKKGGGPAVSTQTPKGTKAPKVEAAAPVVQSPKTATVSEPGTATAVPKPIPTKPPVVGTATLPKAGAVAAPKVGVAVAPVAAPTTAPVVGPAVFTQLKPGEARPGATEMEIIEARVNNAVTKLVRGRVEGLEELLKLGGIVGGGADAPLRAKQRSQLARYLKEKPEVEEGLNTAIAAFEKAVASEVEPGRQAFTGGARSLAGGLPAQLSDLRVRVPGTTGKSGKTILAPQRRIIEQIQAEAKERRGEFAKRADVQAFKAAFKEQGFGAFLGADTYALNPKGESAGIGSGLVKAQGLLATDPQKAQETARETLTMFASVFPKQLGRLFPSNPSNVKQALSPSKKPRSLKTTEPTITNKAGLEVPNPKYDVGLEAVVAAIQAIFAGSFTARTPGREAQEKINRREDLATRGEVDKSVSPGLVTERSIKAGREQAAIALTQRGLTRARVPAEIPTPPIDFSRDVAFQDAEIKRIQKEESEALDSEGFKRKPFGDPIFAGLEFQRRYPSEENVGFTSQLKAETQAREAAEFERARQIRNKQELQARKARIFKGVARRAMGGPVRTTGGFGRLPGGFQRSALRQFGELTEKYGYPVKLGTQSQLGQKLGIERGAAYATPSGTINFEPNYASTPATGKLLPKGTHGDTFAHEYGHVIDQHLPRKARNAFLKTVPSSDISRRGADREDFADLFMDAWRGKGDPYGILDFIQKTPRSKLPAWLNVLNRRAAGGPVPINAGGLLGRLAKKGYPIPEGAVLVGEEGEELLVPGEGGQGHVIDNKATNIPMWMRRAREGRGFAKDLTSRAPGGPIRGFGGRAFRSYVEGEKEAIGKGVLTAVSSANVQRVFVVNWPTSFGRGPASPAPAAATAGGGFDELLQKAQGATRRRRAQMPPAEEEETPPRASRRGRISALQRVQAEAEVEDEYLALKFGIQNVSAARSSRLSLLAQRSMPMAAGEAVSTTAGGRGEAVERARKAEALSSQANQRASQFRKEAITLRKIDLDLADAYDRKAGPNVIKKLAAEYHDQAMAVKFVGDETRRLTKEAADATKEITSSGGILRNFTANFGGIIGGTILFGGVLTAVQGGLSAIGTTLGPVIEKLSGYQNVTASTTSALADQDRQAGGAIKSVVALGAAQTGLSASTAAVISPLLEQRAATEAGNKAISDQIGLLVSSFQIQRQNQGGFDRGLTQTTGGFFGTPIGGIPSTAEQIGNLISDKSVGITGPTKAGQPVTLDIPFTVAGGGTGPAALPGGATPEMVAETVTAVDEFGKTLDFVNNQMAKGGESAIKFSHDMEITTRQASIAIVRQIPSLKDFADKLDAAGVGLTNIQSPQDVLRALQAENIGGQAPDASLLIKQLTERIIPNQLAAFEAEANLQLNTLIPAQRALEVAAQPPTPFGAGFTQVAAGPTGATPIGPAAPTNIGGFSTVDPAATTSFNNYKTIATSAMDAVIAKAKEGEAALAELGVPPEAIAEMRALGQQAQGIELGLANRQAAVAAAQYNHQLFQLNRSLADALALTGKQVGAQGQLGKLQRQNFELGKLQNALQIQSQELSLGLTQRQINFQRALAGFQAPGETAEERAARIAEAKVEADYAQRQLDIQKQLLGLGKKQFVVGVQIFDESARRQVADLQFALAELKQTRALSLDTAAAQQALAAIRARQAQINSEIGVAIDKSTKKASLAISTALEIANKSGEAFNKILIQTANAWSIFVTQGATAVQKFLNLPGHPGSPNPAHGAASGIIGDTLGPTQLTIGEAAGEKVAVIKNPKIASLRSLAGGEPASGGGVTILVDVHDNDIKDEGAIDALIAKVSRAVENSINRKTSLLGLRGT